MLKITQEWSPKMEDEMPNLDICGTAFKDLFTYVLDVDAKTRTAASSATVRRQYLTITLRGHTGYEMIHNQRGANESVKIISYPASPSRIIALL